MLLTQKQRELMSQYANENCSLSEIAEREGISRQGVRDTLKRAEEQLRGYEKALKLVEKFDRQEKLMAAMRLLVRWTQRNGPGCAARTLDTAEVAGRRSASARTSGAERQTPRQRRERAAVRAASLTGRRETMLPRSASGRRLTRSTASSRGRAKRREAAETGRVGRA
jgi:predicted DNA-binding protein YlxM (UPF0122 family)